MVGPIRPYLPAPSPRAAWSFFSDFFWASKVVRTLWQLKNCFFAASLSLQGWNTTAAHIDINGAGQNAKPRCQNQTHSPAYRHKLNVFCCPISTSYNNHFTSAPSWQFSYVHLFLLLFSTFVLQPFSFSLFKYFFQSFSWSLSLSLGKPQNSNLRCICFSHVILLCINISQKMRLNPDFL